MAVQSSPRGKGLLRMLAAERQNSELRAIAEAIRQAQDDVPRAILERARRRGELREDVELSLLFEVLRAVSEQVVLRSGSLSATFLERLVDLVLRGALSDKGKQRDRRSRAAVKT
jgi:hypothetical protein